jgi:DNA invertase Pin-like site-specific DNA recombinase
MSQVYIYTRISSASSYNNGNKKFVSLENQALNCVSYLEKLGINKDNVEVIEDIGSAWKNRHNQCGLFHLLNKHNITIIINSICRFSRYSLIGYSLLEKAEKHNITIYFVEEGLNTANERHSILIKQKILFAEEEAIACSRRQKLAIAEKKKKGWEFGNPGFGYKMVMKGSIQKKVPNKLEKKVLDFIIKANDNDFYEDKKLLNREYKKIVMNTGKKFMGKNKKNVNISKYDYEPKNKKFSGRQVKSSVLAYNLNKYKVLGLKWTRSKVYNLIVSHCGNYNQ